MAKMAKQDHLYDADVYCPFYRGTEHKQVMRCEGPVSGTALRLGFAGKNKRAEYQAKYCNTAECAHCLIYRCLMLKYEEEGTC